MKEGRPFERPSDLSPSSVAADSDEPRIPFEDDAEPRIKPFDDERALGDAVDAAVYALQSLRAALDRHVGVEPPE